MPSHMSTIGVPIETPEEFDVFGNLTLAQGERIPSPRGTYHRLKMGDGAELWAFRDLEGEAHALAPHFDATSRFEVQLTQRISAPDHPLEGGFHGWAQPDGDTDTESEGEGIFPFVFDVPDFLNHEELVLPARREVALAAFAHELGLFDDEDAFEAERGELKLAAESFIPSGLFTTEEQPVPGAFAVFAGRILAWNRRWNELTSEPFAWIQVKTLGGEIEIVCDLDLLEKEPVVGGIVMGNFWLSGRLLPLQ